MSFRYTNNLVGALKHRLLLESAHRKIASSTFKGECNGIEVELSGYGTILAMQLVKGQDGGKHEWESFYRQKNSTGNTNTTDGGETTKRTSSLDMEKLSVSIRTAVWVAMRKINAAKEDAHYQAMRWNDQKRMQSNSLAKWYEHDATTLHPLPFHGLKQETATPWMQGVRFGLSAEELKPLLAQTPTAGKANYRLTALTKKHQEATAIPCASVHPLYTPSLLPLESDTASAVTDTDASLFPRQRNTSRLNTAVLLAQQRKEMAQDERDYWDRVELIQKGQQATIPNGVKRPYAESFTDGQSTIVRENIEESVQLRFN